MRALFIGVTAILAALNSLTPGIAAPRPTETIHTVGQLDDQFHQSGSFEASGAFTDAGSFTFHEDTRTLFHFGANGADRFGIAHSVEFFESSAGKFQLENTVKFSFVGDVSTATGTWTVLRGSGAYARLRGQGTIAGTITGDPEVFDFYFTGKVDLA